MPYLLGNEITGQTLSSLVHNVRPVQPFLAQNGIFTLNPNESYPVQSWLKALRDLFESGPRRASNALMNLGHNVTKTAVFPSQTDFESAITHMNYPVAVDVVTPQHYRFMFHTPHPDDYLYGLLHGLARRFLTHGFIVYYEDERTRRDFGGNVTIIHVQWN